MAEKMIHIPGRKMIPLQPGQQPVIRLTPEAYNVLMEITAESYLSVKHVASQIIIQAQDLIVFDRDEQSGEEETDD